ncbi:N-alpha-acetyltransferase 60 [Cimex lectularius]|uniref:N-alpha-acetyltransferase 60 n=1 Tax=Cimex lectularius TaxID=79782 RepID=A0A8I6RGS7_CIMLE|nr:N-alpha-acetyltransferase 60 [Cimex lectularius]
MDTFSWYNVDNGNSYKKNVTKSVPLCNLNNLQLRFLCPSDLEEVRALCRNWFPIDYPYNWYEEITSNPRFYSLAAIYEGVIIGLIVAEIKSFSKLNKEDKSILSTCFGKSSSVAYMLSLGVSEVHRRNGIASLLLDNLISHLTAPENRDCKALFLHVLTTNKPAIHFYEHRNFRLHSFLPYYYYIKGMSKDGFTYVLYLNGGHSPWGLYDYLKHYGHYLLRGDLCRWFLIWLRSAFMWVLPGMRRMAMENTTVVSVSEFPWTK